MCHFLRTYGHVGSSHLYVYPNDVFRVESSPIFGGASFGLTGDFARHDLILSHLITISLPLLSLSLTSYNQTQYANMPGRAAGKYNGSKTSNLTHDMLEAAASSTMACGGYFDFQTHALVHRPIEIRSDWTDMNWIPIVGMDIPSNI